MNKKQQTIDTYNKTADLMAKKFNGIGARVENVKEAFDNVSAKDPKVLEIGCGNGRDAGEIVKYTKRYLGIDVSKEFIRIARENVPAGTFQVADVEDYPFPKGLDAVFAFASLIHLPKESLKSVFERSYAALNPGGILRISMKHTDRYMEVTKEDEFGTRTYYFYSQKELEEMLDPFSIIKNSLNTLRGQTWVEILARK